MQASFTVYSRSGKEGTFSKRINFIPIKGMYIKFPNPNTTDGFTSLIGIVDNVVYEFENDQLNITLDFMRRA